MTDAPYRGRFAPSPTGPLHIGSLIAAIASYLDARAHGGQWLVRIEDLDPPRELPGAAQDILSTLEAFGFEWDGPVLYQSERHDLYQARIETLLDQGHAFACACTRKEIAALGRPGTEGLIYPGTCRRGLPPGKSPRAIRLRVDGVPVAVSDRLYGMLEQNLATQVGDFIIKRADGLFAYQLAVVIDDAEQGITDVVRGSDLLSSTPRQRYLQTLLALPTPRYLHIPVAVNHAGEKLSKQTQAPPIDPDDPGPALWQALTYLGLAPPAALARAASGEIWQWALPRWQLERLPRQPCRPAPHTRRE